MSKLTLKTKLFIFLMLIGFGSSLYLAYSFNTVKADKSQEFSVTSLMATQADEAFKRAIKPIVFQFPKDHGAHPEFRDEWWYVTGNTFTEDSHRFSYQLTFFRRALSPLKPSEENTEKNWQNNSVYMAHFAVADHQQKTFYKMEKWGRPGAAVAGVNSHPFTVWLDDWSITSIEKDSFFPLQLQARINDIQLNLTLNNHKPIILQGDHGLSQKNQQPGNASYYYSLTRLSSSGSLQIQNQHFTLEGYSWMDREWSTSALAENQSGWDWFSLQLKDNTEVMFYQLRRDDGSIDAFSSGVFIDQQGLKHVIHYQDISLTPLEYWSHNGRRYPIKWQMSINTEALQADWVIEAAMKNQIMNLSIPYWEGAINLKQAGNDQTIGYGFLEMTGY